MEETNAFMLGLGQVGVIGMIAGISWLFYGITKAYAKESAEQGRYS
jgi:O-antigen ligase